MTPEEEVVQFAGSKGGRPGLYTYLQRFLLRKEQQSDMASLGRLLDGEGPRPMRDMVALNVGLAIFLMEEGLPLDVCMARAREAVRAGLGRRVLYAA